jgi:hypothetical protein
MLGLDGTLGAHPATIVLVVGTLMVTPLFFHTLSGLNWLMHERGGG